MCCRTKHLVLQSTKKSDVKQVLTASTAKYESTWFNQYQRRLEGLKYIEDIKQYYISFKSALIFTTAVKRRSVTYSRISVTKNTFCYVLTFASLFNVHLVQFFLLCRIHKKFQSAHASEKIFSTKTKINAKNTMIVLRASQRYFQYFSHIYSKSSQTGLRFWIYWFFYTLFHLR